MIPAVASFISSIGLCLVYGHFNDYRMLTPLFASIVYSVRAYVFPKPINPSPIGLSYPQVSDQSALASGRAIHPRPTNEHLQCIGRLGDNDFARIFATSIYTGLDWEQERDRHKPNYYIHDGNRPRNERMRYISSHHGALFLPPPVGIVLCGVGLNKVAWLQMSALPNSLVYMAFYFNICRCKSRITWWPTLLTYNLNF